MKTPSRKPCPCLEKRDKLIREMLNAFIKIGFGSSFYSRGMMAALYASGFSLKARKMGVKGVE